MIEAREGIEIDRSVDVFVASAWICNICSREHLIASGMSGLPKRVMCERCGAKFDTNDCRNGKE